MNESSPAAPVYSKEDAEALLQIALAACQQASGQPRVMHMSADGLRITGSGLIAPAPATPSKLLLSAEQINGFRHVVSRPTPIDYSGNSLVDRVCDQALIALSQERKIAGLERELAELKARIQ